VFHHHPTKVNKATFLPKQRSKENSITHHAFVENQIRTRAPNPVKSTLEVHELQHFWGKVSSAKSKKKKKNGEEGDDVQSITTNEMERTTKLRSSRAAENR
jgi:hypothetical protein